MPAFAPLSLLGAVIPLRRSSAHASQGGPYHSPVRAAVVFLPALIEGQYTHVKEYSFFTHAPLKDTSTLRRGGWLLWRPG
ncbi:hypothetical protein DAEQUDRAFT_726536 [Daedalea quercina L-15889]|uniref:Uncharacterized protein n=1 Tax=Daedalea quercina L-15889 TaxID=1314783 RepID=A0A165QJP4_9APHY|nr:hypothetical protein DAEQUDRAFT_726536 [Daedalea quercina L-15889]